jgi:uncharacterized SAM-binding protein YcdF (DUF218 family)
MFELLTQIIVLVGIYYLLRYVLLTFIPRNYLTWIGGILLILILVLALFEPTDETVGAAWSILSFPLRPIGLVLVLLGNAFRGGIKKADTNQIVWATMILLICSLPLTAYLLTSGVEESAVINNINRREQTTVVSDARAIVVLGDGTLPTDPAYRIRTQLNNANQGFGTNLYSRLSFASELYRTQTAQGSDPFVIVSAGPQPELDQGDVATAENLTSLLVSQGVSQDRIVIDSEGLDARTSAESIRRILNMGAARETVILVAPTINVRRATSTFTEAGFNVVSRPTDFFVFQLERGGAIDVSDLSDLIPSAEALAITTRVVDEYLATLYYFMRGWLVDPLGL